MKTKQYNTGLDTTTSQHFTATVFPLRRGALLSSTVFIRPANQKFLCFLLLCRRACVRSRSLALSSTASFLVLRKQCPRRRASRQTRKTTRQLHRSPPHPPQLLPLACAPRSSASPSASQTVRAWQRARSRYNQAPRRSLVRVRRTCLHPRPRRQCPPPLWLARQPLSRWSILRYAPC